MLMAMQTPLQVVTHQLLNEQSTPVHCLRALLALSCSSRQAGKRSGAGLQPLALSLPSSFSNGVGPRWLLLTLSALIAFGTEMPASVHASRSLALIKVLRLCTTFRLSPLSVIGSLNWSISVWFLIESNHSLTRLNRFRCLLQAMAQSVLIEQCGAHQAALG